jgi:predicted membrane-bound mannosyltransferase
MHATKETWVLSLFAMLLAAALATLWTRRTDRLNTRWLQRVERRHVLGALALGALVSMLCYSTFLTHPQGIVDSFKTYATYLNRGSGDSVHVHPPQYYLSLLAYFRNGPGPWWSEGLILVLFVVGALASLWRHRADSTWAQHVAHPGLARFLTFYTLLLVLVYSLLPYKTPWLLLNFWQSGILVAGIGAVVLVRSMPGRVLKTAMCLLLLAPTVQLMNQGLATNSPRFAADRRNPYVYAHSSTDVADFGRQMEAIAAATPNGHPMLVAVAAPDAWPLPWYLRRFENIGFWSDANNSGFKAALPEAVVVIAAADLQPAVQKQLRAARSEYSYQEQTRSLRPTVFFSANIRDDVWQAFLKRQETSRPSAGGTP